MSNDDDARENMVPREELHMCHFVPKLENYFNNFDEMSRLQEEKERCPSLTGLNSRLKPNVQCTVPKKELA